MQSTSLNNNNNNDNYQGFINPQEFVNSPGIKLENISEKEANSILNDSTSLIKTKVDNWIDRTVTPQLTHTAILRECEQMTPEENREMIIYAAQLMQDRLNNLNENMRLTWIVRDNLLTLTSTQILMFGQSVSKIAALMLSMQGTSTLSFFPFGLYENLLRLRDAIQMHNNPSNNLLILQKELPSWQEYFESLAGVMPCTITTCEKSFSTQWVKFDIPNFISALWEENKIFKIEINGNTCFFHAISKDTCNYYFSGFRMAEIFHKIQKEDAFLQLPITICEELNQFSSVVQDEFNACLEKLATIVENEQRSAISHFPVEIQQIIMLGSPLEKFSESEVREIMKLIKTGQLDEFKDKFGEDLSAEETLMFNMLNSLQGKQP